MIHRFLLLCSCCCVALVSLAVFSTAFSVPPCHPQPNSALLSSPSSHRRDDDGLALFMASKAKKKKKPSMAERRKLRQQKSIGGPNPYAGLKSPDFSEPESENQDSDDGDDNKPIEVANPKAAAEKAKELLKAQRESVDMLTMVKETILDKLSDAEFESGLEANGYAVVDDFLGSDNNDEVLKQLLEEGQQMLSEGGMEIDTENIGKGQYIVPIAGGEKQYAKCPRMVEIVVSATKHIPEAFNETSLQLDASACAANLRAFDRTALKASLSLLTGNDDDSFLDDAEKDTPMSTIVTDPDTDKRRLSLYYYIVPSAWNTDCGGGIEFEGGKVDAKQDRLVILYSDKTQRKAIAWKGSDDLSAGNVMELHLIETNP